MHPKKSSGLDKMNPALYQNYWHIIGKDVSAACIFFTENNAFLDWFNDTHIVLTEEAVC